jgi:sigma54-dependent transcription regulator
LFQIYADIDADVVCRPQSWQFEEADYLHLPVSIHPAANAFYKKLRSRVGAEKDNKVDVRVIATTNKDLKTEIAEGRFREDLYHRLAVILIKVPSLNERREDILKLISHFADKIASRKCGEES